LQQPNNPMKIVPSLMRYGSPGRRTFMRIATLFVILAGVFAARLSISSGQTTTKPTIASVFDTYCSTCHNGTMRSPSGALLDKFDAASIADQRDVWARAYRQVQAGTMPPVGAPRPDRATYDAVLASIEQAWGGTTKDTPATSQEIAQQLAALLLEQHSGRFPFCRTHSAIASANLLRWSARFTACLPTIGLRPSSRGFSFHGSL
jgi:mono/diheme cytochrome c family protein